MNKWHYLAWLLLMIPNMQETTFVFENGTQQTFQQELLILQSQEAFEGSLYRDDAFVKEITLEDWHDQQVIFDHLEPGIYSLYDKEEILLAQAFYNDHQQHIAFSQPVKLKQGTSYLFNSTPIAYIYDSKKDEFIEFQEKQFTYLEKKYNIYVDDTIPIISFNGLIEEEKNTYYTNQSQVTIHYEDEWFEVFDLPDSYQKTEKGYQTTVDLYDGMNDLSLWGEDMAKNKAFEDMKVILDTKAPFVDLPSSPHYTNQEKIFLIQEEHLDTKQSKVSINEKQIMLENNQIILQEPGTVQMELYDKAGNFAFYEMEIVIDKDAPMFSTSIINNKLSITSSEPLLEESFKLNNKGEMVSISDFEFKNDGYYQLSGKMVDRAGNMTIVDEWLQVDVHQPVIKVMNNDPELVHKKVNVQILMEDMFMQEWSIHLYRNNELIQTWEGDKNYQQEIVLDETDYLDGQGVYRLEVLVQDSLQQATLQKTYILDTKCAPIEMLVNGFRADQVETMALTIPLTFDFNCSEGIVFWKLFAQEELVDSGTEKSIKIDPLQGITRLELEVTDDYGHQQHKSVRFTEVVSNDVIIQDIDREIEEVKVEEKIVQNNQIQEVSRKTVIKETEASQTPYLWIGGVIIAIISLQQYTTRRLRSRQNDANISSQQTLSIQDIEN